MQFTPRKIDSREPEGMVYLSLEPVISGMGMALVDLSVFRSKGRGGKPGGVQVRAIVLADGNTGVEDCSRVHRAIWPRLELAFPDADINLEVSSPGIDRLIKDGREFAHYVGRGIRCYRTDISDWSAGVLLSADEEQIVIQGEGVETILPYQIIAKARLCDLPPAKGGPPRGAGG